MSANSWRNIFPKRIMEYVDILTPPTFEKSGIIKPMEQAWADEDWIGTFNLWVVQNDPVPSIVYQMRSPQSRWAPNKLDVTAGGHYMAGEGLYDGLREAEEEMGKKYVAEDLTYLGRKMFVGPDALGNMRHNVVDISILLDNAPLETYRLQEEEVYAVASLPIAELLRAHDDTNHSFAAEAITASGDRVQLQVSADSFPFNWDKYHHKMVVLADRFLRGEKHLMY